MDEENIVCVYTMEFFSHKEYSYLKEIESY